VKFDDHVSETRIGKVLDYLSATDESCAGLKADVQRTEFLAKLAEAFAYKAISVGSVEDKKAEAKLSKEVQEKWETHFKAIAAYETVRARREHGQLLVELFRTHAANQRKGNI
jgi:hypothetical protein